MKIIFGEELLPDKCIAVICLPFTQHIQNQSGLNYNLRCCSAKSVVHLQLQVLPRFKLCQFAIHT